MLVEYLDHEGGRRECQRRADQDRCPHGQVKKEESDRGKHRTGRGYLQGAKAEHQVAHQPQARRFQLDADNEQQQNDADFREVADFADVVDQLETVWADDDARDQETRYRAQPGGLEQRHCNHRGQQKNNNV